MIKGLAETPSAGHDLLRILFVEHGAADVELALRELQNAGFEVKVDVVQTPRELAAQLAPNRYDVVLADYRLPGWTGMDALELLRGAGLDIPLILVSGTLGEEAAVECVKLGAADYVLKDHLVRLPMVVRRALKEKAERDARAGAEDALRQSEARYRGLVEATFDGIVISDQDVIVEANPGFATMFGYDLGEVIGRGVSDFVAADSRDLVARQQSDTEGLHEFMGVRKDGETIRVESVARMLTLGDHVVRLAAMRDITGQRRLEDQLRQAQKMEAVGQLAGGVAHDFNNVLTAIFGYADFLTEDLPAESSARQDVEEIRKAATRAASLTRQLLAFSRQQVLEPLVLNLNDVVGDLEKMLGRLIGEDLELRTVLAPDLGNVLADAGQVEQVILNLAVNARDAMPTGGKLTIETANAELSEQYAGEHQPVIPGSYVMLAVSDTGVGMDQKTRARIFEPFFTTKEKAKGTGLGLSTVYGIVKQSGGYIWAYSELGRGATFKVYLPRVDAPVEAAERTPELVGTPTRTETILLAEDDELLRPLVRALLAKHGYTVLEAASAAAAEARARDHQGPIDLLLTDVVMPGDSGRELARRLAEVRPEMRVLYMSGYTDDAIVRHGILERGIHYLQKPFTPAALARRVHEVLGAPRRPHLK